MADQPIAIRAHELERCPACGGEGQVIIGEHYITMDMAIDAGDRSMAGTFFGYEWGECDECSGTGVFEAPK